MSSGNSNMGEIQYSKLLTELWKLNECNKFMRDYSDFDFNYEAVNHHLKEAVRIMEIRGGEKHG